MTKNMSAGHAVTGWCDDRHVHDGRHDHTRQPTCRNFISDAAHTARLMTEAREHDRKVQHRYPGWSDQPSEGMRRGASPVLRTAGSGKRTNTQPGEVIPGVST
jgi:hypothetical protein